MDAAKADKIRDLLFPAQERRIVNGCCLMGRARPATADTGGNSLTGRLKSSLKSYGRLYYLLLTFFTPIIFTSDYKKHRREILTRNGKDAVILNVGSGPLRIEGRGDIINVDIFAFREVDVCIEPGPLPFREASVDCILSTATLEHMKNPWQAMAEFKRVLKPGGELLCYIPFLQPFHAAPDDYQRWTQEGACLLAEGFSSVQTGVGAGPTCATLWVASEWLALVLSFGNSYVYSILGLSFMALFSPLKFIDIFLERHPDAANLASAVFIKAVR